MTNELLFDALVRPTLILPVNQPAPSDLVAVVVLYHPDPAWAHRISSIVDAVDELLIVVNSQPPTTLPDLPTGVGVAVIRNQPNAGVAAALNQVAAYAIGRTARWLRMLDQDSRFAPRDAQRFIKSCNSQQPHAGICCPAARRSRNHGMHATRFAMTSGSLLNLEAFRHCGPFDEKLFIDSVDYEYCLRLRKNGWKIMEWGDVLFHHHPGTRMTHRFAGVVFSLSEHPPWRHYFMARNRLSVMFRYLAFDPVFFLRQLWEYPKQLSKILIFEKEIFQRLLFMGCGVFHFMTGRYPNHA